MFAALVFGAAIQGVFAQVMQSTNYRIQSDSVNIGGGSGTSTNYSLESTVGEAGTGLSTSTNYLLYAGYQQMQVSYLAVSNADNVTMSPSLGGVTGGTSNGSTAITVTTDNAAGYQMTIAASTTPAMQSGASNIPDYTPGGANPDFSFTNAITESQFGFSPEGTHIPSRFKDNGTNACATGSSDTALACWDGLSTTPATVAQSTSPNHPSGTATTIRFRVEVGSQVVQLEGTYTATTTLTAIAL